MKIEKKSSIKRAVSIVAPVTLVFTLGGCFGDDDPPPVAAPAPAPAPAPPPPPPPPPPPTGIDVSQCLGQEIPGTGITVAQAAVPDVLNIDPAGAPGFPNGRTPADPVIDVILAVLLLDLTVESPATFASLPLNPGGNDVPLPSGFPFLADPQGDPFAPAGITGSAFNFRTDPESAYVRVDRTAVPAVSTALIPAGDPKLEYNDADPAIDATGEFVDEIVGQLDFVATALQDDLTGLGLNTCADDM